MKPRGLMIALFVSVALNLFAIGAVVGGLVVASRAPSGPAARPERSGPAIWAAGQALSPEWRAEYRRLLREQGPQTSRRLREVREARREAWELLGREPFDEAAATRALDAARAEEMAARRAVEARVVEFAGRLPPQERARLAERLGPAGAEGERPRRREREDRP
jgi:uncharacterized membrane protein